MKAHLRKIRISPKKANLVAGMVRGKKVEDALNLLKFLPKKFAPILYKVVHSAASNAKHNFKQSIDDLYITKLLVTKGPTYKRSLPISRGRTQPIRKRTAHITVEVGVLEDSEIKVSPKGKTTKKTDKVVKKTEKTVKKEKEAVKPAKSDKKVDSKKKSDKKD